ncbi:MAG: hypothetical protein ACI8Y7_000941 [Candidatus Woesearchaeota archaeon]|jgi:hypothetical protein
MKKSMKKITSIGVATTVVAATLTGAFAADLADLPAPFVENGVADFNFVIGDGAAIDFIGALDIATHYQGAAVTESTVSTGSSSTTSVSDGWKLESSGQSFVKAQTVSGVETEIRKNELPVLLADGVISDTDYEDEEYEYSQEIRFAAVPLLFQDPDDEEMAIIHLDLDASGIDYLFDIAVDFDTFLDVTTVSNSSTDGQGLADSESFVILGKPFTFDSSITDSEELTLYGSDETMFLSLNEPQTVVTASGASFDIEITGANNDQATITLSVNGVRKVVSEGDSTTINGLDVYIQDAFINDIPVLEASANLFVGSEELTIPRSSRDAACATDAAFSTIELNNENVDGLKACVKTASTSSWIDIEEIIFRFDPTDIDTDFMKDGDEVTVPILDSLKVIFEGPTVPYMAESRELVEFYVSGNNWKLKFENEDGDEYDVEILEKSGNGLTLADDFTRTGVGTGNVTVFIAADNTVEEDVIFWATEGTGKGQVSKVYQLTDIDADEDEVTIKDMREGGSEFTVQAGDEVEDTGLYVRGIAGSSTDLVAAGIRFYDAGTGGSGKATSSILYTKNDMKINFSNLKYSGTGILNQFNITLAEDVFGDIQDDASNTTMDIKLGITESGDLDIIGETGDLSNLVNDEDSNFAHWVTALGTYVVEEIDDEDEYIRFYVADEEVSYNLFLAPTGAVVSTTSAGGDVTTQSVNQIPIGVAMTAADVENLASVASNLIVIGGPCSNSVAAELLGNPADCTEGFTPGTARIELFDLDSGKVAMLVAGYSATDTQAASRAVAVADASLTGQSVRLTVSSAKDYTVSTVTE